MRIVPPVALGLLAVIACATCVEAQTETPVPSGPIAHPVGALRRTARTDLGTGDSVSGPQRSRGELLARGALVGTGVGALAGAGTYLVLSRRSTSRDRSEDPLGYLLWSISGATVGLLVGLVAGALSGR